MELTSADIMNIQSPCKAASSEDASETSRGFIFAVARSFVDGELRNST
jgi:hypothetical protein